MYYKEEKLPEKWCIKRTPETDDLVTDWFNKNTKRTHIKNNTRNTFMHFPYDSCASTNIIPDGYTEITIEQFKRLVLKEEEFVLPEKWKIKITEDNQKTVGEWIVKNDYQDGIDDLPTHPSYRKEYFVYPRHEDYSVLSCRKDKGEGYTEITYEQFLKYVLKQKTMKIGQQVPEPIFQLTPGYDANRKNSGKPFKQLVFKDRTIAELKDDMFRMTGDSNLYFKISDFKTEKTMEKEIIGYKLIKKQYEKAAAELVRGKVNTVFTDSSDYENQTIPVKGFDVTLKTLKEAGVLDLWFEPIYKSEEIEIELGTPKRKFIINNKTVTMIDGQGYRRQFNISDVEKIRDLFTTKEILGYNVKPVSIQFGCEAGTALTEKEVITIQQKHSTI